MGHQHWWERVDTFFKIEIQKEILHKLMTFYKISDENIKIINDELGNVSHLDFLQNPAILDQLNLSKACYKTLLQNDDLLNNSSYEFKYKSSYNTEFMNEFKEDLIREKIYMSSDFKLNKTKMQQRSELN